MKICFYGTDLKFSSYYGHFMACIDEDDFEALRQRRKMNLQKQLRQEQDWRQLGHGMYIDIKSKY